MQYGSQTVPITAELENLLAFKAKKGMQLLGFVTNDPAAPMVARYTYMSVSFCDIQLDDVHHATRDQRQWWPATP